eukprot:1516115-Amphidinium_carterae.2
MHKNYDHFSFPCEIVLGTSQGSEGAVRWLELPCGDLRFLPAVQDTVEDTPMLPAHQGKEAGLGSPRVAGLSVHRSRCPPETRADDSEFIYEDKDSLDQQIGAVRDKSPSGGRVTPTRCFSTTEHGFGVVKVVFRGVQNRKAGADSDDEAGL